MIALPDCTITPNHARGLRREDDRWVENRTDPWQAGGCPKRFGPRTRAEEARLRAVHGPDRVIRAAADKRRCYLMYVVRETTGLYRLLITAIEKRPDRAVSMDGQLPVVATPHAVERMIQVLMPTGATMISTVHGVFDALNTGIGYRRVDSNPPGEEMVWTRSGNARVWLPKGLALVSVPDRGDAVIRTVVAADGLIGRNRLIWEELGASKEKVRLRSAAAKATAALEDV